MYYTWMGFLLGCIFTVFLGVYLSTDNKFIKSGKEFIIENATYKCTKTNELKEGK